MWMLRLGMSLSGVVLRKTALWVVAPGVAAAAAALMRRQDRKLALTRGETLVIKYWVWDVVMPAPECVVALVLGDRKSPELAVPVVDGSATIDASMSADMKPGPWHTAWRVEVDGATRFMPGPKIKVKWSATEQRRSPPDPGEGVKDKLKDGFKDNVRNVNWESWAEKAVDIGVELWKEKRQ